MLPAIAAAHSGFLDDNGCHNNSKLGKYECHNGLLAGQTFATKQEALKALAKKKQELPKGKAAPPAAPSANRSTAQPTSQAASTKLPAAVPGTPPTVLPLGKSPVKDAPKDAKKGSAPPASSAK